MPLDIGLMVRVNQPFHGQTGERIKERLLRAVRNGWDAHHMTVDSIHPSFPSLERGIAQSA